MLRRCVDLDRAASAQRPVRALSGMRLGPVVAAVLLAACSSAPPLPPIETYPSTSTSGSVPAQPAAQSSASTATRESPAAPAGEKVLQTTPDPQAPASAAIAPLTLDNGTAVPPAAQQQFDAAVALAQSGDLAGAERAFDTLNAQYPSYSGPLVNLAVLRTKAGKLEAAEQALQAAIERNPNSAAAFNHLGIVYRRLGRFKDADGAYQHAVELDPNYATAYLNLGVLCDLYLQQPQRALQAFERYLELLGKPDSKVSGWVTELKARLGNSRSARSDQ